MKPYCRDTWIEVNLDAIRANVQVYRSHLPASTRIMAVVKADGYGHGAVQVAREALAAGADSLAVAMLDEALVLRKAGIAAPILVLGFTPLDCVRQALHSDIQLTAYHADWVLAAAASIYAEADGRKLGIHVKVDTGMGRIGVRSAAELKRVVDELAKAESLEWSGIFTHFACADDEDLSHAIGQHERFRVLLAGLTDAGYQLPTVHCCNSAAAMISPEWGYDTIRLGISLYGLYPSPFLKRLRRLKLIPALQLKTRIVHVKTADDPFTVSYGATYTADAGEQIATLPIGYADGFSRALSGRGHALHNGRRVPLVGRVCMDQTMISIPDGTGRIGDEIVLYGTQGEGEISLDEVADLLGTINYEIPCMLNGRVPRVYLRQGEIVEVSHGLANKHQDAVR